MAESFELEENIAAPLEARITDYSAQGGNVMSGLATSLHGKILKVGVPVPFALLAPVKIECGNSLLMGEVVACEPASYGFDIEIEASLTLQDVSAIEFMASHFNRGKIPAVSLETGKSIA